MIIKVKVKNTYGICQIYPLNYIKELEILTGYKTLTKKHISALKSLGHDFLIVSNDVKF